MNLLGSFLFTHQNSGTLSFIIFATTLVVQSIELAWPGQNFVCEIERERYTN